MVVSSSSGEEAEDIERQESLVSMDLEETRQIIREQNELFEESLRIDKLKV